MLTESYLTISDGGSIAQIAGHGPDLSGCGTSVKRRASHVEPCNWPLWVLFHAVRACVRDESKLACWTRSWRCLWRVQIIGGPVLAGRWRDREHAIAAEVAWLETNNFGA